MLRSNKGITLTSLIIYLIGLMLVVALMSSFANYFYKNINQITIRESSDEEFARFLAYLTKDINSDKLNFINVDVYNDVGTNSEINYIVLKFKDEEEHQYLSENNTIYFIEKANNGVVNKKIALCKNVSSSIFTYDNANLILMTDININNKRYTKTLTVNV